VGVTLIAILGLVTAGGAAAFLFVTSAKKRGSGRSVLKGLEEELAKRTSLKAELTSIYSGMIDLLSLRKVVEEMQTAQEALKAERGRIMITQAELETVESRLRELEEIEREFDASGIETKQELTILQSKHAELASKNKALKDKIAMSNEQIGKLLGELQLSAQAKEQIMNMQSELIQTQERIDNLLVAIEAGNEAYFISKRRYDALDIEYAQLYEKFSESDSGGGGNQQEEEE